ncbi:hypothetical protein FVEG_15343 [Fusarium verticillioides 7600]|uniref:Uncharacterized protein n=1 Tax=Gibberella moniliformis (strain M3125 / FGSC 7600) TaxID=334819 RepID=W7LTB6_GIBM7|nr:hypothetical protein FVEG_15343 [Fusarium verticillioides 7600]EWG41821.1 hypothetical protein FVEG_15343 [Fusarium verticillioides 7600]
MSSPVDEVRTVKKGKMNACSKENTPMGDSIRGIAIAIAWPVSQMRRVTERQFKLVLMSSVRHFQISASPWAEDADADANAIETQAQDKTMINMW